jgi:hypothetical protein
MLNPVGFNPGAKLLSGGTGDCTILSINLTLIVAYLHLVDTFVRKAFRRAQGRHPRGYEAQPTSTCRHRRHPTNG